MEGDEEDGGGDCLEVTLCLRRSADSVLSAPGTASLLCILIAPHRLAAQPHVWTARTKGEDEIAAELHSLPR